MIIGFPRKLYTNNLLLVLIYVQLTYCSFKVASSGVNNNHVQCVETERDALLHFKQGIRVDHCGYLDGWGHNQDCCQWRGIRCNNHSGEVIGLKLPGHFISLGLPGSGAYSYNYEPCLEGTLSVALINLKHLKYLDLSINNFDGQLPKFIGSLASLEHLNLSNAGFVGVIPQEIGNLSRLTSLDLNEENFQDNMRVESLWWLSRMRLLRELDLSFIDLSVATNTWLSIVNNLPFLQELRLDTCSLSLNSPSSLSYINSSTTLGVVSLSGNNLNDTSIFEWLLNLSGLETSLTYLDLSDNEMFGNDLQLSERSMKCLDNLCSLQTLNLVGTGLNYKFSDILRSFSKCPHKALMSLQLSQNNVWGSILDNIGAFSSLRVLGLASNQLNGTISQFLGKLTRLEGLDLSFNSLNVTLTTEHLSNLSKLRNLILYPNTEIVVNISADWIPPFQLDTLMLRSCKIGPYFPRWITTQKTLSQIDISNANISDTIPISFWNSSLWSGISSLDMSNNMINGTIPDVSIIFDNLPQIDLSYNLFEGVIPSFLRNNVSILNLNNNKFSKGLFPFLCPYTQMPLSHLDLSSNCFSEKLPDCWSYFDQLTYLHLDNNRIWGSLPTSMGSLNQLFSLQLSNNNLSGSLPTFIGKLNSLLGLYMSNNNLSGSLPASLVNCSSLVILDLANNSLIGHIPLDFGHSLGNLVILSLQSNNFVGVLPTSLCDLSSLNILDLSDNYISGTIPSCLYKLVSMNHTTTQDEENGEMPMNYEEEYSSYSARFVWKRYEQTFVGHFSLILLKGIDISNNKLEGHIPESISSLVGLKFLNLSRNNLSGVIVSRIGQLASLESLDLSHNHLSGKIPVSLTQISSLSSFDISENNLTGQIPISTQLQSFDASSYMGNPGLCGAPLLSCVADEATSITPNGDGREDKKENFRKEEFMLGLYISVVLGFIVGFWGVCGTLVLKRSWRHAYFRFYEHTRDKIYDLCNMGC